MRSFAIGGLLAAIAFTIAIPADADAQRRRARRAAPRTSADAERDPMQLDAEARGLFVAGREAFDAGRYDNALDYFTRAYALSGRPGLLFNIASSAERLRRDEEALRGYQAYLEAMPEAPNREYTEGRIAFLREQLRGESARAPSVHAASVAAPAPSPPPREVARPAPAAVPRAAAHEPGDDLEPPIAPAALAVGEVRAEDRDRGGDVTHEAWFWTLIGIAVVGAGAGITAGVIASQSFSPDPAAPGDFGPGGVIVALEQGP